MSSFSNTPNFDNLLLQSLMGRLQIHPPNLQSSPLLSLEDLLFDAAGHLSDSDEEDGDGNGKTQLAKEESKLEKDIIRTILSGKIETLKPNSGQAVAIGEHHVCIGFHQESGSDYRVWEWHGHLMLFDEENGYSPEYIYGNYFERLRAKPITVASEDTSEKRDEEEKGNLGLRELIEPGDSGRGRILHRNINAGSARFS
ncbi:uncharacterized protein LOC127790857 [Diospyros lotus]|uniref:uncharacterized protein LOC127790857 n=1 Tax=Diospyros lotus TaxID=55363 RepID=UPI002251AAF3|nr:uncharacterized protein LOC127790857 [Diospyros lotus]